MEIRKDVSEYCNLVFRLKETRNNIQTDNKLSQEVTEITFNYQSSSQNISKACNYLNSSTEDIIKGRNSSTVLCVGKDAAPLLVSVKKLADKVLSEDVKGCDINIEEKLKESISTMEDNSHMLENFARNMRKSIQNIQFVIKQLLKKQPDAQENNLSTVSELSSFLDKDIVASSPINLN